MPASYPLNTGMGFNSVLCFTLPYITSNNTNTASLSHSRLNQLSQMIRNQWENATLLGNPPPATSTGRPHGALSPSLLCIPGCCPPHGPGKCSVLLYRHKPTWKEVSKDMFVPFASYLQKIKSIDKVLLSRTFLQHWWVTFWWFVISKQNISPILCTGVMMI